VRRADFSRLARPGRYRLIFAGAGAPAEFEIGTTRLHELAVATLKGFYYQRTAIPLEPKYAGKWARAAGHPDTLVLVHPSVSANTMKELVALTKEKPDALNYGSYGKGSQPHLLFEMLGKETGAKIQQISYRGIAPAITAVLAGEVQTTLGSVAVAAGHIEARKLKALAIGRQARLPSHPEIPTLREAGFPDIEPLSWFGLFAPAGTPLAIVAKIQQAVAAVLNEPEFKARFIYQAGHSGVGSTPAAFMALTCGPVNPS